MEGFAALLALAALIAAWWFIAKKLKGKNWLLRHFAGSTAGIVAMVLSMIVFVALGIAGSETDSALAEAERPAVEVTADTIPAVSTPANYSIVSDDYKSSIKRSVLIALDERITEAELAVIAKAIKAQATHPTDRTFINYRVEGATSGTYWATTHYNPDLSVRILGMNASEAAEAKARPIPMFASVSEMIEDSGDYDEETGSYRLISDTPLHIHLSPKVFKGDTADIVETELQRAVMYGIYKTLIHTSADQVRVTSTPIVMTLNPVSMTHQDTPRLDVNITRAAALETVQQFLKVDDLQNLVAHQGSGGFTYATWTPAFAQLYHEGDNPGLKAFFPALLARSAP
ncbi:MAG: hypothetical protein QNL70_01390 [Pseudomonas sp.]